MSKAIKQNYFFPHPVEAVWGYLTEAELLSEWLMPNDFKLALGHQFTFKTKPMPQFKSDGIFHCKILEIKPLEKLIYSWNSGPGDGSLSLKTVVEWTLVPKNNGVELQLVHSGFTDENKAIYEGMMQGWLQNMQKMEGRIQSKNGK
jgi:uncharacterized protein YndB with AHSA1/START domain